MLPPREFPRPSITLGTAGEPSTFVPSMSFVVTSANAFEGPGTPPEILAFDPSGQNGA
jgi:hypothetical protein